MKETTPEKKLFNSLQGISRGLIVQFVLGVILATYAAFNPELAGNKQAPIHYIFLALHVLVALTLVLGSVYIVVLATKSAKAGWKKQAWIGLVAIWIAFAGGTMIFSPDLETTAIFVMSLGFIVALVDYGSMYFALKSIEK
jgi:hypothetical protein